MFPFTFICLTETYERSNQECTVSRGWQSLSVQTKNEIGVPYQYYAAYGSAIYSCIFLALYSS